MGKPKLLLILICFLLVFIGWIIYQKASNSKISTHAKLVMKKWEVGEK